jgi:hypothetical protein
MRHGGHHFAPAGGGEFGKKRSRQLSGDVGEGIAVEKEKRGAAMTLPQEFQSFVEGEN